MVARAATLALLAAASSVSGEAVELTGKNFEKKVFGKKNRAAFIKFLAPW
jgi:hypothetical protein